MGNWSLYFPNHQQDPTDPRAPSAPDSASLSFATDFTVEIWIRKKSGSDNTSRVIMSKDNAPNIQWELIMNSADGSAIKFCVRETSGGNVHEREWTGLSTGTDGEWHHYAWTFDGDAGDAADQMECFEDGVSQGGGSLITGALISNTFDSDGVFRLGGFTNGDGDNEIKGFYFFDVRLWNDIRTQTEIDDNKLLELVGNEAGLVANWCTGRIADRFFKPFPTSTAVILDRTSNNNDLALPTGLTDSEDTIAMFESIPAGYVFDGSNHVDVEDEIESYAGDLAVPSDGGGPSSESPYIEHDELEAYAGDLGTPFDGEGPSQETPYIEHDRLEFYADSFPVFDGEGIEAATDDLEVITLGTTGPGGPGIAPIIQNVVPPSGSALAGADTPVQFDIVDPDSAISLIVIWVRYVDFDGTRVVFDGERFTEEFTVASSRSVITDGFQYSVVPRSGWLGEIESLRVRVVDATGEIDVEI